MRYGKRTITLIITYTRASRYIVVRIKPRKPSTHLSDKIKNGMKISKTFFYSISLSGIVIYHLRVSKYTRFCSMKETFM